MTLKTLTKLATEQISRRMVIRMAGFHLWSEESEANIRGFDYMDQDIGLIQTIEYL